LALENSKRKEQNSKLVYQSELLSGSSFLFFVGLPQTEEREMIIRMEPDATRDQIRAVVKQLGERESYTTWLSEVTQIICLSDDAGLCKDALKAMPGVQDVYPLRVERPRVQV